MYLIRIHVTAAVGIGDDWRVQTRIDIFGGNHGDLNPLINKLTEKFCGFRHTGSLREGAGQGQSNQAQQHSSGSVAQLDRAADF